MSSLKLKSGFPLIWGDLAYQNQSLKRIALTALLVTMLALTTTCVLLKRKPQVLVMDQQANVLPVSSGAPLDAEAEQAARKYLGCRYVWQPENQVKQLSLAKEFIAPSSVKAFEKTANELINYSKSRNVSQRVYPTALAVDAKESHVQIIADRFTEIQGLKAATLLRVILTYQAGPRTTTNPWGIYILKEEEVQ